VRVIFADTDFWTIAVPAITAAVTAIGVWLLNVYGKWKESRRVDAAVADGIRVRDRKDVWDRQADLLDRAQHQIDELQKEYSRRSVSENAAREENARLKTELTYIYADLENAVKALQSAGVTWGPLPPRPTFGMADSSKAEQEFVSRTQQHNSDLLAQDIADTRVQIDQVKKDVEHGPAP